MRPFLPLHPKAVTNSPAGPRAEPAKARANHLAASFGEDIAKLIVGGSSLEVLAVFQAAG